jgi:septal ring factor EnvC (AmiA/AmiB activator)
MVRQHYSVLAFLATFLLFAGVLAVALNDRIQVERRLDDRDERLADTDRRLIQQQADLRRQQRDLAAAVRRLERLEHPTRLDLQRLFRGLLEAAAPRDVRRLVRRLQELGVVLPRGGEAPRGGNPPPGP